ncbi:hypothetical protein H6796_02960 [Candidatus Nomurabacteria bacterium]|nr:hypothetical protein [Candidatus Nomurabacteria bacterium]
MVKKKTTTKRAKAKQCNHETLLTASLTANLVLFATVVAIMATYASETSTLFG